MNTIVNHFDPLLQRIQTFNPLSLNGLERYSGRALGLTDENDTILLPPTIKNGWDWICDHYTGIGLKHTKNVVWDNQFEVMRDFPNHNLSVFIFSRELHAVFPDAQWLSITDCMNSKNEFIDLCTRLRVPTPTTWTFQDSASVHTNTFTYPLYLKTAVSVSGLGVVRCDNELELVEYCSRIDGALQIQEEVDALTFLNLTYEVENGVARHIAVTEQILKGCSHDGNIYPARSEPWSITDPIANYMVAEGMRGVFGFDVALTKDGFYVIECNPRYNGSVYPAVIAQKIGASEWLAKNFHTHHTSLEDLKLDSIAYDPVEKSGVVVVNWGCIQDGKLGLLICGNKEEQDAFEGDLVSVL